MSIKPYEQTGERTPTYDNLRARVDALTHDDVARLAETIPSWDVKDLTRTMSTSTPIWPLRETSEYKICHGRVYLAHNGGDHLSVMLSKKREPSHEVYGLTLELLMQGLYTHLDEHILFQGQDGYSHAQDGTTRNIALFSGPYGPYPKPGDLPESRLRHPYEAQWQGTERRTTGNQKELFKRIYREHANTGGDLEKTVREDILDPEDMRKEARRIWEQTDLTDFPSGAGQRVYRDIVGMLAVERIEEIARRA